MFSSQVRIHQVFDTRGRTSVCHQRKRPPMFPLHFTRSWELPRSSRPPPFLVRAASASLLWTSSRSPQRWEMLSLVRSVHSSESWPSQLAASLTSSPTTSPTFSSSESPLQELLSYTPTTFCQHIFKVVPNLPLSSPLNKTRPAVRTPVFPPVASSYILPSPPQVYVPHLSFLVPMQKEPTCSYVGPMRPDPNATNPVTCTKYELYGISSQSRIISYLKVSSTSSVGCNYSTLSPCEGGQLQHDTQLTPTPWPSLRSRA